MPRRRRLLTGKRVSFALAAASGTMLLGTVIATHTVSAINPFYRFAEAAGWREPVYAPPEPTQGVPIAYAPIGWGPDVLAPAPSAPLPPEPALDGYDDRALLAELEAPPLPPEELFEPAPMPAVIRADRPLPVEAVPAEQPAPAVLVQVVTEPAVAAPSPPPLEAPGAAIPD